MSAVDKFSVVVVDENGMCPVKREVLGRGRLLSLSEHSLGSEKGLYIYLWMWGHHKDEWRKLVGHFDDGEYEDGGKISVEYVGALGFRYPVKVYRVTMEKVKKEEALVCGTCRHHVAMPIKGEFYRCEPCCRRLQGERIHLIYGGNEWVGDLRKCRVERGVDVSWWERLVGKWWGDRCGKEGKYWVRR